MKRPLGVLLPLIALTLVACGGQTSANPDPDPDPDPDPTPVVESVTGTVNPQPGMPPVLGVAMALIDPEAALVVTGAALVDAGGGVYVGPYRPVDANGQVELVLPDAAEIPAEVLAPAEQFYFGLDYATCELTTSATGVTVTQFTGEVGFYMIPSVWSFMLDVNTPTLVTTTPVDMTQPGFEVREIISWIYADAAVDITTPGAGCTSPVTTYHFDLSLEEGWNQVAVMVEREPDTGAPLEATITSSSAETLYFGAQLLN